MGSDTVLQTRDLELVRAIARSGGVTSAAPALHLTQSAVSHHLRDLEGRLGVSLFDRVSRRMVLTDAGRELVAVADRVLPDLSRAERAIRALAGRRTRALRISVQCVTAYHWLPRITVGLGRAHPDVDLQIAVEATDDPRRAVAEDRIEVAMCQPGPAVRGVVSIPLFDDEIVGILAEDHPLAGRPHLVGDDLLGETLLAHVGPEDSGPFRRAVVPAGGPFPAVRHVPLTEAILGLARAHQGIGVLARWSLSDQATDQLVVRPFGPRGLRRSWVLLHRGSAGIADVVPTLVALIRSTAPAGSATPPRG